MRWLLVPVLLASACWHESKPAQPAKPQPIALQQPAPVKDLVQPVRVERQDNDPCGDDPCGDPCGGVYGGVVGGVVGGDPCGVVSAPPPPPPPPPPPAPPQNVAPTLLEGNRIAGEKMIQPDDVTKVEIQRSGKEKIVGSFKLCVTVGGDIASVNMLKSTGFGAYDQKLMRGMRQWKYRPYMVNGKAVPVCTAVTFIYTQPQPPPPQP
jgi:TonB family protein